MATTRDRKDVLLEAGLALASELSLEAVLRRIVELAVDVTGARYGALGVLGPDGLIQEFITVGVSDERRRAIGHPPTGRGILGVLIEEARPLRIAEISRDPRSFGFPPNHPPMGSFLGAPVEAHGRVFGNIYLTEKQDAEAFTPDDEEDLVVLAIQAGVAVANAELYARTRQRELWLDAVAEITTGILSGGDPNSVLNVVAARARELVGADLATIAVPDEATSGSLVLQVAAGAHAEELQGETYPADGSLSGDVIRTGRPLVVDDAAAGGRGRQPIVRIADAGPAIFVPLTRRGGAFGTLAVANLRGGPTFGEVDIRLVTAFADQASLALEYARTQQELHRLAVLEDRERIARELHDGVIQSLFAVGMGLQGAAMLTQDVQLERRVESAVTELDRVIRDLRNYIFGLRPGILADRQLDQALRELVEDFGAKTGVTTILDVDPEVAAELASRAGDLIQLTREALSNVGRHAEATTCRVSLHRHGDVAVLEIDDDGGGFDPALAKGSGSGIPNLESRAAELGGELAIESTRADGTTVRFTVPL
ncbi:MAG TPA: GAF domain-containing sensor histidine kinase [Actinomycetota bacterium]|nr:GAF domain-containing sensor histidine kinase [Actinomycetota bacterium]